MYCLLPILKKTLIGASLLGCYSKTGFAQQNKLLNYKDLVFEKVSVTKNIYYDSAIKKGTKSRDHLLDLYEPVLDSNLARPLIIWIHGGGFKFGSKKSAGTPLWSRSFARRGYVCVALNYRLSKKRPLAKFPDLVEGCFTGIEDLKMAIEFLRKNAAIYKIDTSRIIAAGNSAGGMIALQAVYSNRSALQALFKQVDPSGTDTSVNPLKIVAIINFWGGIFETRWLENTRIPIVSVQGTNDKIVPYDHKNNLLFGSYAIHRKADSLGIPNVIKPYPGIGHELKKHFLPFLTGRRTKTRWMEAGQFAADFLYKQLFN
jgi:dienelactone hydrolase